MVMDDGERAGASASRPGSRPADQAPAGLDAPRVDPSRLKRRRKELGLSLRDVERSTQFRVSNAYLSQLENGKIKNPSLGITCLLATIYKVPMDTMIEWLAPKIKEPPRCPTCKQVIWPPEGAVRDE